MLPWKWCNFFRDERGTLSCWCKHAVNVKLTRITWPERVSLELLGGVCEHSCQSHVDAFSSAKLVVKQQRQLPWFYTTYMTIVVEITYCTFNLPILIKIKWEKKSLHTNSCEWQCEKKIWFEIWEHLCLHTCSSGLFMSNPLIWPSR